MWMERNKLRATSWKPDGSWMTPWWPWDSKVLWWQRPTSSWATLGEALLGGQGRWPFPSTQHWWDPSGVLGPPLSPSGQKRHGHTRTNPAKGHEDAWRVSVVRRSWESWVCSAWRREGSGEPQSMYIKTFLFLFEFFSCFSKCKLYHHYHFHISKSLLSDPSSITWWQDFWGN